MAQVEGIAVLAESLVNQGIEYVFGVVGWPYTKFGQVAESVGLKYIAMRNEQAAAYAAQVIGYLTERPAVSVALPGPGLLHVLAGMANATENAWPLLVIGGAAVSQQEGLGTFREYAQVEPARHHCKYSARPSSVERIPFYVEKAIRVSMYGRPGACYLDFPEDLLFKSVDKYNIEWLPKCPSPPRTIAAPADIRQAVKLLAQAQCPLVIIGKGAAYSRAEDNIRKLVVGCKLPFIATPMGKGLLPDDHDLCVAPARSRALQKADVILLLGARLNWILHYGSSQRYNPNVKIIQVDIEAEQLNHSTPAAVALHGDVEAIIEQMNVHIKQNSISFYSNPEWLQILREKAKINKQNAQALIDEPSPPMNYYNAFYEIEQLIPRDAIFISEGSKTMDISRSTFSNTFPRHRLDAGTFGTMGVGAGFAIAAATWCRDYHPDKRVICLQGDSAFGFGGMEVETVCRYQLPIIFIIINNSGITKGISSEEYFEGDEKDLTIRLPATALLPNARYDQMMEAFGGKGFYVSTREALRSSLTECMSMNAPCLINVIINPTADRKKQEFWWRTSKI